MQPDFGQSAAYLKRWLDALKQDNDLIFKAAAEAQKAVDHINATIAAASGVSHAAA
ncbi:zincin-like metallopeptidase domain-containing protein [Loktanella sp. Alg231-35]|uniref:zincin-like metallopeptidase domain-containing protein n=1 Tax=Loktanella sp. Alg231-35 TaxID=1922220 RepID=UPI001EECA8CD|nr:zincin-like metallopeptidase domain-containing protein [Loktanella sp. Alg231-35]